MSNFDKKLDEALILEGKCPFCGSQAYIGLNTVECTNPKCSKYKNSGPKLGPEFDKIVRNLKLDSFLDESGYAIYGAEDNKDYSAYPKLLVYRPNADGKEDQIAGVLKDGDEYLIVGSWGGRSDKPGPHRFKTPYEVTEYLNAWWDQIKQDEAIP
jgi:hypothetical protein